MASFNQVAGSGVSLNRLGWSSITAVVTAPYSKDTEYTAYFGFSQEHCGSDFMRKLRNYEVYVDVMDALSSEPLFQFVGSYFRNDGGKSNNVYQYVKNGSSRKDFGTDSNDRFNINVSNLGNVVWGRHSPRGCISRMKTAFSSTKFTYGNNMCLSIKFLFE